MVNGYRPGSAGVSPAKPKKASETLVLPGVNRGRNAPEKFTEEPRLSEDNIAEVAPEPFNFRVFSTARDDGSSSRIVAPAAKIIAAR